MPEFSGMPLAPEVGVPRWWPCLSLPLPAQQPLSNFLVSGVLALSAVAGDPGVPPLAWVIPIHAWHLGKNC